MGEAPHTWYLRVVRFVQVVSVVLPFVRFALVTCLGTYVAACESSSDSEPNVVEAGAPALDSGAAGDASTHVVDADTSAIDADLPAGDADTVEPDTDAMSPDPVDPQPTASTWTEPAFISAAGVNASAPRVAVDSAGTATAVWLQDDDLTAAVSNAIWSSTHPVDGTWSNPVRVSDSSTHVEAFAFDMSSNGQALVTWRRFETSNRLRVSHRDAGQSAWSSPAYLHGSEVNLPSFHVSLDLGPDGVAYLVFAGRDAENDPEIFFSAHTPGVGWNGLTILSDGLGTYDDDGNPSSPSVAASSAGQWLAIWETPRPGGRVMRVRGSLANGSTSDLTPVSDPEAAGTRSSVWGDPAGGFVRAWEETDPVDNDALLRLVGLDDTSSGEGDVLVYDAPDDDGAAAESTVFFGGRATTMLNMVDAAGNTYMRITSRSDAGTWSTPVEPLDSRKTVYEGSLAVDASGTITLAFRQGASPWRAMVTQLLPGATEWTLQKTLSDHVSGVVDNATGVRVAAGAAGSTMVVWQQKVDGAVRVLSSQASSDSTP